MQKIFKAPDYDEFFLYETKHGDLRVLKADFKYLRRLVKEWEARNPEPEPPLIPISPDQFWNAKLERAAMKMARKNRIPVHEATKRIAATSDPVPDKKDKGYLKAVDMWEWSRFAVMERHLMVNNIIYDMGDGEWRTLSHIIIEDSTSYLAKYQDSNALRVIKAIVDAGNERFDLYRFFVSISQITWEKVKEAAEEIGIVWDGVLILDAIPKGEGESQSIYGLGVMAARELGVSAVRFGNMTIEEQASILAADLAARWLEKLSYDRQRERMA